MFDSPAGLKESSRCFHKPEPARLHPPHSYADHVIDPNQSNQDQPAPQPAEYVLSGKTSTGTRSYERIEASTANEAVELLRARGYSDVRIHRDDSVRLVPTSPQSRERQKEHLSPREAAEVYEIDSRAKDLWHRTKQLRGFLFPALVATAYLLLRRVRHKPIEFFDVDAVGLLILIAWVIWYVTRGVRLLRKIELASMNADYDRVLSLLPAVAAAMKRTLGDAAAAMSEIRYRSKVLGRRGQLAEALAEVEKLKSIPECTKGHYWLCRSMAFEYAREWEQAIECLHEAIECNPDDATPWMSIASISALWLENAQAARIAMDAASSIPAGVQASRLSELVGANVAILEGRYDVARGTLERLLPIFLRAVPVHPSYLAAVAITRVHLTIACARLGDKSKARRHFKEASRFLSRHNEQILLDRCRRALGDF